MSRNEAVTAISVAREPRRVLLVAISLLVGCSFDPNPSLGWNLRPDELMSDAAAGADVDNGTDASSAQEAGVADAATAHLSCRAGLYTGQFTCTVSDAPVALTLQIQFILEQLSLDLPEATANTPVFIDVGVGILIANLAARLDCTTGVFHADLGDGFGLLIPIIAFPFFGTIDGQIDEAGTLAGTWQLESPQGSPFGAVGTCDGSWSASSPATIDH